MQPTYLPWIGYFDLIDQSDFFVFFDNVQFSKQSWQQRNKIKTVNGELLLTIPIFQNQNQKINEVKIDNKLNWKGKHERSIKFNYNKAPYFDRYSKFIEDIYRKDWEYLIDLNIHIIKYITKEMNLEKKFILSSKLDLKGNKTELLVNICKKLDADTYLSPLGSKEYIEENNLFKKEGIKLEYQHFEHQKYHQLFGDFIPYLSIIDLLFNEGEQSLKIIRSCRRRSYTSEEVKLLL